MEYLRRRLLTILKEKPLSRTTRSMIFGTVLLSNERCERVIKILEEDLTEREILERLKSIQAERYEVQDEP